MKKIIATVVCILALSVTAIPLSAQTRSRSRNQQVQTSRYNNDVYRDGRYGNQRNDATRSSRYDNNVYYDNYGYDNRSFWEKHRDKITTAAGVGAGALIGGIAGGKKGAIIGAITGGGGAAVYTYGIRNKDRRF